jgi:hypothetical protein
VSKRLVPAYVAKAGWGVVDAYNQWLDDDDLDTLRDAVIDLAEALVRDPSTLKDAPDYIVERVLLNGRPS